jgi:uracil-DNA glycosylase
MNSSRQDLDQLVASLLACKRCPAMHRPAVSGLPVPSKVFLVGQAPGDKEPLFGKPFAWTAGKTMFKWFLQECGLDEETFRHVIYMGAVCRCFPGKKPTGGDRVPDEEEIARCAEWMHAEFDLLKPELVIPVGKLAILQFMEIPKLDAVIGKSFRCERWGHSFDVIPLPHPSGASPWHRIEPGKTLLKKGLQLIAKHPAWPKVKSKTTQQATLNL